MNFLIKKTWPRYLRLLPTVVIVGGALLVVNTSGLVHEAYAEAGEQVASLTTDTKAAHEDYAGGEDDQVDSASAVNVMNALGKRRKELDAREGQLAIQANMIAAAEKRVDAKIAQLKTLQAQISALLVQRDDAQKAQVASLVKTYSTMKPKDAARIFNSLPDEVLVPVAHDMKSDVLALVLANMNADNAKALTVKLANKLALPQTTDALAPVAAPAPAPVPGPQTSATLPVQVAAAAPAPSATPVAEAAPAPVKRKARARKPLVTAEVKPLENKEKSAPAPAPTAAATPSAAAPAAATPTPTPAAAPAPAPKS